MSTTLIAGILWVALTILLLVVVAYLKFAKDPAEAGPLPEVGYKSVVPLTPAEQELYGRLVAALPECVVLPQVPFSRFMRPSTNGKVPLPQYRALQDRLAQKSVDYLVCLKDFTVVAAIELDDATQEWERDEREQGDLMLGLAGVNLVRLKISDMPTVEQLRTRFTHGYGLPSGPA
jgi:hypothetical protein